MVRSGYYPARCVCATHALGARAVRTLGKPVFCSHVEGRCRRPGSASLVSRGGAIERESPVRTGADKLRTDLTASIGREFARHLTQSNRGGAAALSSRAQRPDGAVLGRFSTGLPETGAVRPELAVSSAWSGTTVTLWLPRTDDAQPSGLLEAGLGAWDID